MEKSTSDICDKSVVIKISSDRGKTCISVTGGVSASRAVASVNENFPGMYYENFLKPDITAISGGYMINILAGKSVKDYLSEYPTVLCETIFSVAEKVKKIFDDYGEMFFSQILFDYGAIFTKNESLTEFNFIFAPFSNYDRQRVGVSEFLRILFLHMAECDISSEQIVKDLLKSVSKWENEGYEKAFYTEIEKCIDEYKCTVTKKRKKDIFSKSGHTIRSLFSGLYESADDKSKKNFYITIVPVAAKLQYTYIYNPNVERFFCVDKSKIDTKKCFESLKIGRDKSWATIYIGDMTVSGRYGEIFFENGKFKFRIRKNLLPEDAIITGNKTSYILKNGQKIQIGKRTYVVKVHGANH